MIFISFMCLYGFFRTKMYLHVCDHDLFMCEQDANLIYD
jgi:hypothetical protein